jgi:hypothetical protein
LKLDNEDGEERSGRGYYRYLLACGKGSELSSKSYDREFGPHGEHPCYELQLGLGESLHIYGSMGVFISIVF